jgi:Ca2+-binding EF-hand superfamily protein
MLDHCKALGPLAAQVAAPFRSPAGAGPLQRDTSRQAVGEYSPRSVPSSMTRRWPLAAAMTLVVSGLPVLTTRDVHAHDCAPATPGRHFGTSFFDRADTDHDGGVTRGEFVASELERFDAFDANRDGVVTRGEAQIGESTWRARRLETRFQELDRDRNGVLTLDEGALDAARFERLDRDRDGQVTRAELQKLFLGHRAARGAVGMGGWTRWDGNADGVVTRAEAQRSSEARFAAWDTDGDGSLTRREVLAGSTAARRRVR